MDNGYGDPKLAAEQRARVLIDRQLADAGWSVQDKKSLNLIAHQGVACREVVMKAGYGRVDYLLYVDRKVVGVIEAKPVGTTLSGVEWQSAVYANGLPVEAELKSITVDGRLPFVFEASGSETHFTNGYDPHPRARRIFNFPTPATLAKQIRGAEADPDKPTWRAKVQHLPPLDEAPLRPAQITALNGIEQSLAKQHHDFDLHTMLRLPTGIFYAQGVKANVLFFDRKVARPGQPWTERLWVYDLRTNKHFTLKQNPLRRADLEDFVAAYKPGRRAEREASERWRPFTYDDITARDKANLDITWLRDESLEDLDNLPSPDVLAREIVEDLTAALEEFEAVAAALEGQLGQPAESAPPA